MIIATSVLQTKKKAGTFGSRLAKQTINVVLNDSIVPGAHDCRLLAQSGTMRSCRSARPREKSAEHAARRSTMTRYHR